MSRNALNRAHLDHDCPTDVISFLLSEPDEAELAGELVVSTQTALGMAAQLEVPAWSELASASWGSWVIS